MNQLQMRNLIIPAEVNKFKLLKWNLFGLKFLGIFVTSDQSLPVLRLIFGRILILIYIFGYIIQIASLFIGEWTGVQPRLVTIACVMVMFISVCQLGHFLFNQKKFCKIIISVNENVKKILLSAEEAEKKCHQNYFDFFETYTKAVLGMAVGAYIFAQLDILYQVWCGNLSLVENIFKLKAAPFCYMVFPFANISSNTFIAYIIPLLLLFPTAIYVVTWRTFFVCLLSLGVFQLKAFNMKVEKVLKFTKRDFSGTVDSKTCGMEDYLKHCIKEQIEIKIYLRDLEVLISGHSFLDIFVFSSFLCFIIYHLIKVPTVTVASIVLIIASSFFLVILLLYNGLADEITQNDNYTTTAIYLSGINWYEQPVHIKRIILTMMKGSPYPFKLKAFAIEMKYNTFFRIIKGAFSYLTLLQSLDSSY